MKKTTTHRGLLRLNQKNHHHVFLQEAVLSALVVTATIFMNDVVSHYVHEQKLRHWQKYLIHGIFGFLSSLLSIYLLFFIFGYGVMASSER